MATEVKSSSLGTINYTTSAGNEHTVLLRSDGTGVAFGHNDKGQCDIPKLSEGLTYTQVSAGYEHTVLLRSDGTAIAFGRNDKGQCDIPELSEYQWILLDSLEYLQVFINMMIFLLNKF